MIASFSALSTSKDRLLDTKHILKRRKKARVNPSPLAEYLRVSAIPANNYKKEARNQDVDIQAQSLTPHSVGFSVLHMQN